MEIQVRGSLNKESEVMGGLSFELYERYAYRTDKAAVFLSKQFLSRILDAYYYEPHDILAEYDHVIYSDLDGKKVIMLRCDIDTYKVTVRKRDIPDIINYLRDNYNFFYDPNRKQQFESLSSAFYCCDSRLVTETQRLQEENKKLKKKLAEQQKKIDSYEATLSKITDIMKPEYAGPAWSETWDDLVERIKRMKEHAEMLEAAKTDWRDSFEKAQDSRSAFCKKLKEALDVDYRYPSYFPKMEEDILAEVTRLKAEHDDVRGLSLKIEELEEKLKHAAEVEVWYRRTNRELVMERDTYRDTCEELKQDINEWEDRFDKICDELNTPEIDFDEVFNELRKNLNELDTLEEFKAKLAEVIKLPEDMKGTATTEDYISSFEHTKKEWRKMEIKLENYEREVRLLNAFLEEKKKELGASDGAMDVLRNLYAHVKGNEPPLESNPSALAAVCKYEFDTLQTMKRDYTNAKCARAELATLYKRILGEERLDPKLSSHEVAVAIVKHVQGLCDLQHEANMSVKELQKFRDEVYNALNLGYPTTNQHILKVLKERLTANDFYVEGIDAAEYRAFVMKLFEVTGRAPDAEEWIRTNYLAGLALADVKELKQKLEDIKNICDGNSDVMNIIGE